MTPRETCLSSRFTFNTRFQGDRESLVDFVRALKILSSKCQFGTDPAAIECLVRDQFIVGIRNKSAQAKILEGSQEFSLDEVLKIGAESGPGSVNAVLRKVKKKPELEASKPFRCELCSEPMGFKHERNLLRHMKNFHKNDHIESRIVCRLCQESFFSQRGLRRHFSLVHSKEPPDGNATKQDVLTVEGSFKCSISSEGNICGSVFKHEKNLVKHIKQTHKDADIDTKLKCAECNAIFFSDLALRQHYTRVHLDMSDLAEVARREQPYRSQVIVQKDRNPLALASDFGDGKVTSLYVHDVPQAAVIAETISVDADGSILSTVKDDPEPLSSIVVEAAGTTSLQLINTDNLTSLTQSIAIVTADLSEVTPAAEPDFVKPTEGDAQKGLCQLCGKVFQDPVQHYKNVHAEHRPFKCHLCPFSHPLKGHLAQHMRHKHMEGKFVCEVCGAKAKSAKAVKEHIAMVHEGQRPWPCPHCGKTFAKKQYIDEHVAVTHKGEAPFECKVCSEKFTRRRAMLMHKRTVHEGKWFDCNICSKRFKEKCAVENHIKLVHENKFRYNCRSCTTGFKSIKPFKEHMLVQHGVRK